MKRQRQRTYYVKAVPETK